MCLLKFLHLSTHRVYHECNVKFFVCKNIQLTNQALVYVGSTSKEFMLIYNFKPLINGVLEGLQFDMPNSTNRLVLP
jgi:hypothetical protein